MKIDVRRFALVVGWISFGIGLYVLWFDGDPWGDTLLEREWPTLGMLAFALALASPKTRWIRRGTSTGDVELRLGSRASGSPGFWIDWRATVAESVKPSICHLLAS